MFPPFPSLGFVFCLHISMMFLRERPPVIIKIKMTGGRSRKIKVLRRCRGKQAPPLSPKALAAMNLRHAASKIQAVASLLANGGLAQAHAVAGQQSPQPASPPSRAPATPPPRAPASPQPASPPPRRRAPLLPGGGPMRPTTWSGAYSLNTDAECALAAFIRIVSSSLSSFSF